MSFRKKLQTLAFSLMIPFMSFAQAESIFNNITLNESFDSVTEKLNSISKNTQNYIIANPSFPLSNKTEAHLVASKINTKSGMIDKAVFTFADDKLVFIQAKGNVYKTFTEKRKDTARTYMDYEVYVKDKLFLKQKEDVAWVITEEAMHVNLFTWNNIYLEDGYKSLPNTTSNRIPDFIKMGGNLKTLKPILEANSLFTNTEDLDGSDPNAQLQINCFGVNYSGFPRKVEARFGNEKLNVVWILTAKGEEDRIRKALTKQYGKPIFVNDDWEIFNNWQVGLRKDKPEVLLMEQKIGLEYKSSYFKQ